MDSVLSIDPDQPKHAAQVNMDRHFAFLFQESLLFTSISLSRDVSARISLGGLHSLIWVDTLRKGHNVGFLVERLIFVGSSLFQFTRIYCYLFTFRV